MSDLPNRSLAESEKKLTMLLMEVRGTATADRVKLYVAKMTGGRILSEYIGDEGVPVKERAALAQSLVEILLKKDYARLPELPGVKPPIVKPAAPVPVPADEPESPLGLPPDELRDLIDERVRLQLAALLETIAKALRT